MAGEVILPGGSSLNQERFPTGLRTPGQPQEFRWGIRMDDWLKIPIEDKR